MGQKTSIEWTDRTWNPVSGCTKVSPGCANCYAERITERFHGAGSFGKIVLHPERLEQPLHWRKPCRIFVNSMSDLFHEDVSDAFIGAVFGAMAAANWHTFQILTKRPDRMRKWVKRTGEIEVEDIPSYDGVEECIRDFLAYSEFPVGKEVTTPAGFKWPMPNVWLGVSVENQHFADERIPLLLDTPAAVRFISAEPLLGKVDITKLRPPKDPDIPIHALKCIVPPHLDWVICGGESGPGARPMHPDWARSLRDQCEAARRPFFFKQWGEWKYIYERVGRKAAGRELDGREWNEFPHGI